MEKPLRHPDDWTVALLGRKTLRAVLPFASRAYPNPVSVLHLDDARCQSYCIVLMIAELPNSTRDARSHFRDCAVRTSDHLRRVEPVRSGAWWV